MFAKSKEAEIPVFVAPPSRPQPQLAAVSTDPLGVYEKLAAALNFKPAQLLQEQLLRFLNENHIPTYEYDAVDQYLTAIAEKNKKVWIWRPLREQDKLGWSYNGRPPNYDKYQIHRGHGSYRDEWDYRPYPHAVPIHILHHVKKIQDKFGDQVKFLVSDYADPKPDPFIMVTALDVKQIIFGVWDEPSFGTGKSRH